MIAQADKDLLLMSAHRASSFLRTLSNENRLLILCNLVDSEKSVSELKNLLGLHQPTLSQHLARLRADSFVATRRQGKSIYYSLSNEEVRAVIGLLYDLFCIPEEKAKAEPATPNKQARRARTRRPSQSARARSA